MPVFEKDRKARDFKYYMIPKNKHVQSVRQFFIPALGLWLTVLTPEMKLVIREQSQIIFEKWNKGNPYKTERELSFRIAMINVVFAGTLRTFILDGSPE